MQLARFAVQSKPVPVENAVGRVRVLLDLKNHNAGADGMNAAARKEHHIPRLHRHAMKAICHRAVLDLALELRSRRAAAQTGVKLCARLSIGDVPQFGFRFPPKPRRHVRGGMDLQRKSLLRVEDFDQQRKASALRPGRAEQFLSMVFHQPAEVFSRQRPVRNHAYTFRPVADFPGLANRDDRRQILVIEPFQVAPAPDAFFENRLEGQRVKHV